MTPKKRQETQENKSKERMKERRKTANGTRY